MARASRRPPICVHGVEIPAGSCATLAIELPRLYSHAEVDMPVHVIHGRASGPTMFLSAAIHGDEINGVEVIRRVLRSSALNRLRGTLMAIPVVNVFGFHGQSRYLPDRRDLNRSFPGSAAGSLAARLAHLFCEHILDHATHGIDLHTGAIARENLPQIRCQMSQGGDLVTMARAFGTPVILDAGLREGSLRQEASDRNIPVLVYEAGEALRFDEISIRAGVRGVLSVMRTIGMLAAGKPRKKVVDPLVARSTTWVRAPSGGIYRDLVRLGARVVEGQVVGEIGDPLGEESSPVVATASGIVIGRSNLPLVHEGDALIHIARFHGPDQEAFATVEAFQDWFDPER